MQPAFCIGKIKGPDYHLCFHYIDSTIRLLPKYQIPNFKPLTIFCGCTARFVLYLVEKPEDRFYDDEAHTSLIPVT